MFSGPFRWSRNPIYPGFSIILIGLVVHLGSLPALLVPVLFVGSITRFQIIPEERALAETFGDDFHRYKKRVRRWL